MAEFPSKNKVAHKARVVPSKKDVGSSDTVRESKFSKYELDVKRVEKLVEETVDKLTFAMVIPQLIDDDFKLISSFLDTRQLEKLRQVFKKYLPYEDLWFSKRTTHQSELSGFQSIKQIEEYFNSYPTRTEDLPQRDEYDFIDALYMLYNNEKIKSISGKYKSSMSEAAFNFLQDMKYFIYTSLGKMKLTPQETETKEAYLRKMCLHHEELTDEAQVLEHEAIEKIQSKKDVLSEKLEKILIVKDNINILMEECEDFIQKLEREADQRMLFDWKNSELEQEQLQQKVNEHLIDLEALRKKYTEEEKDLRTKRFKTEQHLISVLDQYDKDMQNKQNELDIQYETVLLEREQLKELQEKHDEQATVYDLLMAEKKDYEDRVFEAKLYELKCTIAAKKIQKFYRNIRRLIRISGRRDLLKSKKKQRKR